MDSFKSALRRMILKKLVNQIEAGEFNTLVPDIENMYPMHKSTRQEYQSPLDRSTHNYGYTTIGDVSTGKIGPENEGIF